MSIHDRKEPGADLDPHSMISLVEAFPDHVAAAAAAAGACRCRRARSLRPWSSAVSEGRP
jgi:hypothetical protein